jgi:hypothetical protein
MFRETVPIINTMRNEAVLSPGLVRKWFNKIILMTVSDGPITIYVF